MRRTTPQAEPEPSKGSANHTYSVVVLTVKPVLVSILSSNNPLSADRSYELTCQSVGSRPPAKITWWMDNKLLDNYSEEISPDGNITTSILTFSPRVEDHDRSLICRADNNLVKAGAEEDSIKLNVFYIPIVELELGSNLDPNDIEEEDDVYFECKIQANPQAYKVTWKHNGLPLQHSLKSGIILGNRALALQSVTRQQAGAYSCVASNVEGDGDSNVVILNVMCEYAFR
ncbi:hypothetical protein RUM43_007118 [Polyplax serrata]|uniref:Ig-like domain-containing protein n=1 Tax=Polyplax serrata TaxID=468196 RepID=A0AAN8P5B7_POLSC